MEDDTNQNVNSNISNNETNEENIPNIVIFPEAQITDDFSSSLEKNPQNNPILNQPKSETLSVQETTTSSGVPVQNSESSSNSKEIQQNSTNAFIPPVSPNPINTVSNPTNNFVPPETTTSETTLPRAPRNNHMKTIIGIIVLVVILVFATYSIVQILLERKFATINLENTSFSDGFTVTENEVNTTPQESCEGGMPFVRVLSPNNGEILKPGESLLVSWELCGISPNLLDEVSVQYRNPETNEILGSFDLECRAKTGEFQHSLMWDIPPYIAGGTSAICPFTNEVDFADSFVYSIYVSYASGQYEDVSDMPFSIDMSEYVFIPPVFSDFSLATPQTFARASFLDAAAPITLKDIIFPIFFQGPIEFANFYRVFPLSCGTTCLAEVYLLDVRTGEAHIAPKFKNYFVKPGSSLYIVEDTAIENSLQGKDAKIIWYQFDETSKGFTILDIKLCNITGPATARVYSECILP